MKAAILLFLILCIWIGLAVLSPATVQAELITIGIEAVVDDVQDPDNYLDGRITLGDLITGTYTYDTDTRDSSPLASVGRYEHYAYPSGISLGVGGFDFMTDPADTYFEMFIVDNNAGIDGYSVRSHINLPLSDGTSVNNIKWSLQDTAELALSSIQLPASAPVVHSWPSNYLHFGAGSGGRDTGEPATGFVVAAHVTSAVVIPEPGTILLLGLGGVALVRKVRK